MMMMMMMMSRPQELQNLEDQTKYGEAVKSTACQNTQVQETACSLRTNLDECLNIQAQETACSLRTDTIDLITMAFCKVVQAKPAFTKQTLPAGQSRTTQFLARIRVNQSVHGHKPMHDVRPK